MSLEKKGAAMKLTKDRIEAVRREFGISDFQTGEVPTFSTEGRNKLLAILVCYVADAMLEAEAPKSCCCQEHLKGGEWHCPEHGYVVARAVELPKPAPNRCGGWAGKPHYHCPEHPDTTYGGWHERNKTCGVPPRCTPCPGCPDCAPAAIIRNHAPKGT